MNFDLASLEIGILIGAAIMTLWVWVIGRLISK